MNDVTLREITSWDAEMLVRWRNDPDNARWFPVQPPWTAVKHLEWYRTKYLTDPSQNLYVVMCDYHPIGTVGMTIKHGVGELERMMLGDKRFARGGYMRQGMRKLMNAYGLNQYWLRVMPDNEAVISFHKSNGFSILHTDGEPYINTLGEQGKYTVMARSFDGYWPRVPDVPEA